MSDWALLALLIVCVAAVLALLAYTGLKGWRLFKTARRVQREVQPLLASIADGSQTATARADQLSARAARLQESAAALQTTLARLTVVLQAGQEAAARWRKVRHFVRK
jgi:type II secretory pathway component PulL